MTRRVTRRLFLGVGSAAVLGYPGMGIAAADFTELDQDFESLSPGAYPSGWKKNGSSDQKVVDDVAQSGDQSLKLRGSHGGCWQAIANAPLGGHPGDEPIRLTGSIKPGAAGSFGCHDKFYARVQFRTAAGGWSDGSGKNLLTFKPDGTIVGAGGVDVGSFSPDEWVTYDIRYEYDSDAETVALDYTIDGGSSGGSTTVDAPDWETDISYHTVRSGDFTTYWDNLSIKYVEQSNQVPEATYEYVPADPAVGDTVTFDASAASDPDGSIAGYSWDFEGDGSYDAAGETATHTYEQSGDFSVSLRVTDSDGATDLASQTVAVTADTSGPDAAFEVSPSSPQAGDSVAFDASASSDSDGSLTEFEWDLDGDGQYEATGQSVSHTYAESGEFSVSLRVTDSDGLTDTTSQTVSVTAGNSVPNAAFDISQSAPPAGEPVTFDASSSSDSDGSLTRFEWDIDGDGSYDLTGTTIEHTFGSPGEYEVRLRVTDSGGKQSVVTRTVTVAEAVNEPPSAAFEVSTASPDVGDAVRFDASASTDPDGAITEYRWDFTGDGTPDSRGPRVEHTFEQTGEHTVTLTVIDGDGATDVSRGTVAVSESAFQALKDAHLETAQRVDDIAVSNFGATAKARSANRAYTDAVASGDISEGVATEAIRRLDHGLGVTEDALDHIGPATELSRNRVDLTQSMASPTISTSLELLLTAVSISKKVANGVGLGTKAVLKTAKSKAKGAVKTILTGMLGRGVNAMAEVNHEANGIVGEIIDGTLDTVGAVEEALAAAKERVVESVSQSLQFYDETGMTTTVAPLTGTFITSRAGSLQSGVSFLYAFLSAERVTNNGLRGDTNAAVSSGISAGQEIASEADETQDLIQDAKEFSESFSLTQSVIDLWNDPDLWNVAKAIGSLVLEISGGVVNAFATGAGVGALVKINTTHHVGLFNIIRG